jgi:tetratricopeptide (TPR) repeat protein
MSYRRTAILAMAVLPMAFGRPADNFEKAVKALASKDYAGAFDNMEAAIKEDPDNLKYASEYRMAVIAAAKRLHPKEGKPDDYDRCLKFFEHLTAERPSAWAAWLNYGFAYVDQIPAAGAITQVILANTALSYFTKSIEAKPSWIAYYTRGAAYLFWPKIFGRAPLAVADLEQAMKIQKSQPKQPYHLRAYVALGDAYWKNDELEKALAMWKGGLAQYPDATALKERLAKQGDDLKAYLDDVLDPSKRVDTDLRALWSVQ